MSSEKIIATLEEMADYRADMVPPGCIGWDEIEPLREAVAKLREYQALQSGDACARLAAIKDMPTERVIALAQAEAAGMVEIVDPTALLHDHLEAQTNEPLTLEELREMDGQPVWIDRGPGYGVGWVLVLVWAKSTNIIYLSQANGSVLQLGVEIKNGAKLYRRPPKEA